MFNVLVIDLISCRLCPDVSLPGLCHRSFADFGFDFHLVWLLLGQKDLPNDCRRRRPPKYITTGCSCICFARVSRNIYQTPLRDSTHCRILCCAIAYSSTIAHLISPLSVLDLLRNWLSLPMSRLVCLQMRWLTMPRRPQFRRCSCLFWPFYL